MPRIFANIHPVMRRIHALTLAAVMLVPGSAKAQGIQTPNDSLAFRLLREARNDLVVAKRLKEWPDIHVGEKPNLLDLVLQLRRLGAIQEARSAVRDLDAGPYVAFHLALRQYVTGDLKGALETVRTFLSPQESVVPLRDFASALARGGSFDPALEIAEGVERTTDRVEIMTLVALGGAGRDSVKAREILRQAVALAERDTTASPRSLLDLAYLQVRIGDLQAIHRILPDTLSAMERAHRLAWMVRWSLSPSSPIRQDSVARSSLEAASRISDRDLRIRTTSGLVEALSRSRGPLRGQDALRFAYTRGDSVRALHLIIEQQMLQTPPSTVDARDWIETVDLYGLSARIGARLAAAKGAVPYGIGSGLVPDSKMSAKARAEIDRWLEQATVMADSLNDPQERDALLLDIASTRTHFDLDGAEETARMIERDSLSEFALVQVARGRATDDVDGALQLAENVDRVSHKDRIRAAIIERMPERRETPGLSLDRAEHIARNIQRSDARAKALLLIARESAVQGNKEKAADYAREILEDPEIAMDPDFSRCAVEVLVHLEETETALTWARSRRGRVERANALVEIAESLEPIDEEFWTEAGLTPYDDWCDHWSLDDLDLWRIVVVHL